MTGSPRLALLYDCPEATKILQHLAHITAHKQQKPYSGVVPQLAYHGSTGALLWDFSTGVQYGALQDPLSKFNRELLQPVPNVPAVTHM
jgi:hypothetical protein